MIERASKIPAPHQPVEREERPRRGRVVAGSEGASGVDLDAHRRGRDAPAVVAAVEQEAAGRDRLQRLQPGAHPVRLRQRLDFERHAEGVGAEPIAQPLRDLLRLARFEIRIDRPRAVRALVERDGDAVIAVVAFQEIRDAPRFGKSGGERGLQRHRGLVACGTSIRFGRRAFIVAFAADWSPAWRDASSSSRGTRTKARSVSAVHLASAYEKGALSAGHEVRRIDVASLRFDLVRSQAEWQSAKPPADIRAAQDDVGWAEHIVLIYPLWLGTMPALLKAFLEQLLRPGFATPEMKEDAEPLTAARPSEGPLRAHRRDDGHAGARLSLVLRCAQPEEPGAQHPEVRRHQADSREPRRPGRREERHRAQALASEAWRSCWRRRGR